MIEAGCGSGCGGGGKPTLLQRDKNETASTPCFRWQAEAGHRPGHP